MPANRCIVLTINLKAFLFIASRGNIIPGDRVVGTKYIEAITTIFAKFRIFDSNGVTSTSHIDVETVINVLV